MWIIINPKLFWMIDSNWISMSWIELNFSILSASVSFDWDWFLIDRELLVSHCRYCRNELAHTLSLSSFLFKHTHPHQAKTYLWSTAQCMLRKLTDWLTLNCQIVAVKMTVQSLLELACVCIYLSVFSVSREQLEKEGKDFPFMC
mgnify:CR=1 FL=1